MYFLLLLFFRYFLTVFGLKGSAPEPLIDRRAVTIRPDANSRANFDARLQFAIIAPSV